MTQASLSYIQTLSTDLEHSEHDLQSIDDRLFALRAQARKHECSVDNLAAKREELAQALNQIEHADDVLAEQMKAVEKTRESYKDEAEKLLVELQKNARDNKNVFDTLMEATKYCSIGQITQSLFEVGGQYRRNM